MEKLPNMVDMALDPPKQEEGKDVACCAPMPAGEGPRYPWNLSISLDQEQLDKLNVDYSDWAVGDTFHLHALAKLTSKSENETQNGTRCRVELQITHLAGEDEDEENEEYEEEPEQKLGHRRPYE